MANRTKRLADRHRRGNACDGVGHGGAGNPILHGDVGRGTTRHDHRRARCPQPPGGIRQITFIVGLKLVGTPQATPDVNSRSRWSGTGHQQARSLQSVMGRNNRHLGRPCHEAAGQLGNQLAGLEVDRGQKHVATGPVGLDRHLAHRGLPRENPIEYLVQVVPMWRYYANPCDERAAQGHAAQRPLASINSSARAAASPRVEKLTCSVENLIPNSSSSSLTISMVERESRPSPAGEASGTSSTASTPNSSTKSFTRKS